MYISCFLKKVTFFLLLNTLLQILYQVIAGSSPFVVGICAHTDHKIGRFTLTHLGMKSLAKISNRVSPAEARQSAV